MDGSIPWYLQEDLRRNDGCAVPGLDNFGILRTMPDAAKATGKQVFVIGGGEIYREALAHEGCTKIYLTRVLWDGECDAFKFTKITKLRVGAGGLRYWFEDYERQA